MTWLKQNYWIFWIGAVLIIWALSSDSDNNSTSGSECNSNYSGCLATDKGDYDCRSGSGNGPNYTGKVRVLGYDEYGLDRDGDGMGCE